MRTRVTPFYQVTVKHPGTRHMALFPLVFHLLGYIKHVYLYFKDIWYGYNDITLKTRLSVWSNLISILKLEVVFVLCYMFFSGFVCVSKYNKYIKIYA